jgi:hypothetical protein
MATRKKKTESQEPTVVKGTHLTVTTFPDGKTMLEWDDVTLLKEVQEALKSVEKPKTKRKITKEKQ